MPEPLASYVTSRSGNRSDMPGTGKSAFGNGQMQLLLVGKNKDFSYLRDLLSQSGNGHLGLDYAHSTEDALARAKTAGLDLIEVSPTAQPPVCKIADYGRLKYEQSKKDKDARKKQRHFELREVKLRPKIETHDYETKARMAERLLLDGSKIKVTIMFRGREITYTSFGRRLLDRMAEDMAPLATVEREPRLEGRNMFMILAPRATPTGAPKFSQHREKDPDKDEKPVTHDAAEMEERTSA